MDRVACPPGKYTARLVVSGAGVTRYLRAAADRRRAHSAAAGRARGRGARLDRTTASKVFPVQGPFNFGGEGSRFGAGRTGHIHQGQDIAAAEGTPVVTPRGGTVHWIAYQAKGAGYYVVIAGDDGRHYVFMHLQAGSTAVAKGQPVAAGQRIASVGNTGGSEGPHLHFEIWVNGWWATKASAPIDPLPELQAWARGSSSAPIKRDAAGLRERLVEVAALGRLHAGRAARLARALAHEPVGVADQPLEGLEAAAGDPDPAGVAVVDEDRRAAGLLVEVGREPADVPAVAHRQQRQDGDLGVLGGVQRAEVVLGQLVPERLGGERGARQIQRDQVDRLVVGEPPCAGRPAPAR